MSLCNIYGYLTTKTIKLSDSYQVRIKLDDADFWNDNSPKENRYALKTTKPENGEIELCECTSVTLPSYKPKEEIFEYGNNSKTIIYMDPTSLSDLEIELIEHYSENETLAITNLVNLFLSKLFDEDTFEYKLTDYIPELTVYVFNNIFSTVYLKYVFKELKLVDYTKFDLDYSSADIAKWTLKFSYRSFYVLSCEEDAYAKETKEEEPPTVQESPAPKEEVTAPVIEEATVEPPSQEVAPPDLNNTALQNEFNAGGEVPTGQNNVTDNEIVLNEVVIRSNENPVDLASLSSEDRTDELAYRMMRGELDNGRPRYGKTYDAGYTEEERAKAQSIVNQKDWQGLKRRHDERVAKAEAANANSTEIASRPNDNTNTILAKNDKQNEKINTELKKIDKKMKSEKTDIVEKPASSGHTAFEPTQVAKAEEKKPESKPANNVKTETKVEKKETANASSNKPKDPLNTYANDSGPKYISGRENKEGLTLNQWAYISAKRDYEEENDQKKRNSEGFRGVNFSVGSNQIPMKEKMKFQERYHEEMQKRQAENAPKS